MKELILISSLARSQSSKLNVTSMDLPYQTRKAIREDFTKQIQQLKRIKNMVFGEERSFALLRVRALSLLAEQYDLKMTVGDANTLALHLKTLIVFDSPRFLISEVSSA